MAHTCRNQISSFGRNVRVHLNRTGDVSSVDYWHSRGVRISGSNAGYTMFRGSVKGTGYPLHSPVSPSIPLLASPCAIIFQLDCTQRHNTNRQKPFNQKKHLYLECKFDIRFILNTLRVFCEYFVTKYAFMMRIC